MADKPSSDRVAVLNSLPGNKGRGESECSYIH